MGLGTTSPDSHLHVNADAGTGLHVDSSVGDAGDDALIRDTVGNSLLVIDTTVVGKDGLLRIGNTVNSWNFGTDAAGDLRVQDSSFGGQFVLTANGNLTITGQCADVDGSNACDAVFQPGYDLQSIEEHATSMWENSYLPAIGPTPEGKRISLSVQGRHFGVLNELEKAHIYIDQLNERLKHKESHVSELSERLARLEAALLGVQPANND